MPSHRSKLLDAALELMLSKGYSATTVDEVCAEAGVTKGSFYHHFGSKEELADVLVDHYFEIVVDAFSEPEPPRSTRAGATPDGARQRLFRYLDQGIQVAKGPLFRRGCLLGSFALNLAETHPEMRAKLEQRFSDLAKGIEPLLRAALREGPGTPAVSAPALARQFVAVLQGGIVLAKAADDHGKIAEALRCYRETLRALLGD
ncbi:MAG: TetR/AcrR family transcriptional regulator [Planctomycetota bacterium]